LQFKQLRIGRTSAHQRAAGSAVVMVIGLQTGLAHPSPSIRAGIVPTADTIPAQVPV
jgi:hypothetical protein